MFDKDDNEDFEDAIKLAISKNYKVAYSNQAVEYWFILHFYDHHGEQLSRESYADMINYHINPLGAKYGDSKIVSREFFDILMSKIPNRRRLGIKKHLTGQKEFYQIILIEQKSR